MTLLTLASCHSLPPSNRVVVVQPFAGMSPSLTANIYKNIQQVDPTAILKKVIPLPAMAFYPPRNRYRADSLIHYLDRFGSADTVIIGLTDKDISTSKGKIADWGVMGLGFCPGNACVVSTFRLSKSNLASQLFKVSVHELGHTQGLPHCPVKTCLMRDAEGGNHLESENGFCANCKAFLKSKGWRL